jgi:hypothetical protein
MGNKKIDLDLQELLSSILGATDGGANLGVEASILNAKKTSRTVDKTPPTADEVRASCNLVSSLCTPAADMDKFLNAMREVEKVHAELHEGPVYHKAVHAHVIALAQVILFLGDVKFGHDKWGKAIGESLVEDEAKTASEPRKPLRFSF